MKRILSVILAVLMLVPMSIIGVFAEDGATEESVACTSGSVNIASEASVGYLGTSFWGIDEGALVDGNTEKLAHSPKDNSFTYILNFGSLKQINKIVLYVNGTGECSKGEGVHTADPANCVKTVSVKLYDDTGAALTIGNDTADLYDETDPENPVIGTEAIFEFKTLAISKVEIIVGTGSYGSAYFREIEVYQEIGEHAWTLDKEASIAPVKCEEDGEDVYKCSCGATKSESVSCHTVEEWVTNSGNAATTKDSGMAIGTCTDCNSPVGKILPRLSLTDNEKVLNLNNITVTEDVKDIRDYVDEDDPDYKNIQYKPNETSNPEALFDSVLETDTNGPTNFWSGTAFRVKRIKTPDDPNTPEDETEYEIVTPDNPETTDKDETEYAYDYYYSTLTIELDQVYSLTKAELYLYSNWNNFTITFKGADGSAVKEIVKNNYQNDSFTKMIFTGDVYGKDIKSIVITVTEASWEGGRGLAFTELKLSAHECLYSDEAIASGITKNCVTTFSGTCSRCTATRTDAKIVSHTWQKDEVNTTEDKIVETITEVTCYRNGKVKKHCTVCNNDVDVALDATGDHVYGEQEIELAPTCGDTGLAFKTCTVEGCGTQSDRYVIPPEGEHDFHWVEREGDEADYTHDGVEVNQCSVCSNIDEASGTRASEKIKANFISAKDWTVRYTDFVSPRATFKISTGTVSEIEQAGFSVKIYGVVKKGDVTKEIQVYGDGATGNMRKDGTFSLVVAGGSYTDTYYFTARVEIICDADATTGTTEIYSKNLSTASNSLVSSANVATYYLKPNKVGDLDPAVKALYEKITATN